MTFGIQHPYKTGHQMVIKFPTSPVYCGRITLWSGRETECTSRDLGEWVGRTHAVRWCLVRPTLSAPSCSWHDSQFVLHTCHSTPCRLVGSTPQIGAYTVTQSTSASASSASSSLSLAAAAKWPKTQGNDQQLPKYHHQRHWTQWSVRILTVSSFTAISAKGMMSSLTTDLPVYAQNFFFLLKVQYSPKSPKASKCQNVQFSYRKAMSMRTLETTEKNLSKLVSWQKYSSKN